MHKQTKDQKKIKYIQNVFAKGERKVFSTEVPRTVFICFLEKYAKAAGITNIIKSPA